MDFAYPIAVFPLVNPDCYFDPFSGSLFSSSCLYSEVVVSFVDSFLSWCVLD